MKLIDTTIPSNQIYDKNLLKLQNKMVRNELIAKEELTMIDSMARTRMPSQKQNINQIFE